MIRLWNRTLQQRVYTDSIRFGTALEKAISNQILFAMNELMQTYHATKQQALETMHNGNIQAYLIKLMDLQRLHTGILEFKH